MCGISGIFGTGVHLPTQTIQRMTDSLAHRGPDDAGIYVDDHMALGQTRLSILDLSANGHQPMESISGRYLIVFNGEVFNYRSVRAQLVDRGYSFRSDTDTEVILYAYAEWGPACLERFNGMFAFAVYDRERRSVFIARDRLGIKPLYLARSREGALLFSSEVRSILSSGLVPPQLNRRILPLYLKYQTVPAPDTLIEGIEMLLPGHWMEVTADGEQKKSYWNVLGNANPDAAHHTADQARDEVRRLLTASVERRLISDVPLGAFLSGGIDSSIIVGLMSRLGSAPVRTFTIGFEDPSFEDGVYAQRMARQFRTDHTELKLSYVDILQQIPQALAAQDHPSGDGVNTYLVSRAVKEAGLSVALSGLGGDELFAGYSLFGRIARQQRARLLWRFAPQPLRRGIAHALYSVRPSIASQKMHDLLVSDGSLPEVYPLGRQCFGAAQAARLLSARPSGADPYASLLRASYAVNMGATLLSRISYAEARTYMHDVLLRDTDQMSMASALEVRVPFLDHELVEYAMGLPDAVKRPNGVPKRLLVEAFSDLLPATVINRPKQGFIMPFDTWMRGPLKALCLDNLDVLAHSSAFQAPVVHQYWNDFRAGNKALSWSRLWLLVSLGAWCKANGAA
ncbi:MAG: asparagine synthase (glutamine-hydrolyzing) [Rhodothermales bacterium]|nr:asparagine synthase (glutamine-hydrolyzing) [Rhodothermales bacterium]